MKKRSLYHCMIVHAYYPLAETRVQREAETLLKHGYAVDVICLRDKKEPATEAFKDVHIHRLPVQRHKNAGLAIQALEYLQFLLLAMFKVTQLYRQRHYRTIQVHNLPDFLVFAAWIPKLLGSRIILDLHDLMPEFYMGRFNRPINSLPMRLVRLQERLSCRFADHVITVSEHWRQALIQRGVPAHKCSVVMNVADDAIFRPPATPPKEFQSNSNLHLIYHGTVTYRYGLDLVLQAMARLPEQASDIHLTIVGDGDYMNTLKGMAKKLDLEERVKFHPTRPAEELPDIILTADAGIVPYRNDPFTDSLLPTKLMEYAALGLPAIAARTTAIEGYFSGTMVEFFTPNDVNDLTRCMRDLYYNRSRLSSLAQKAEVFNKRYNWSSQATEYVDLVKRLGENDRTST